MKRITITMSDAQVHSAIQKVAANHEQAIHRLNDIAWAIEVALGREDIEAGEYNIRVTDK